MRDVTIKLVRPDQADQVIGFITYRVDDEVLARGSVIAVDVPGDRALQREINRHLADNPDQLSIEGGIAPTDIGTYVDGLRHILLVTALNGDFDDFEYDPSSLPRFEFGPDELG